jgi:hypothetical protein
MNFDLSRNRQSRETNEKPIAPPNTKSWLGMNKYNTTGMAISRNISA